MCTFKARDYWEKHDVTDLFSFEGFSQTSCCSYSWVFFAVQSWIASQLREKASAFVKAQNIHQAVKSMNCEW
jgi:hypothetical protein